MYYTLCLLPCTYHLVDKTIVIWNSSKCIHIFISYNSCSYRHIPDYFSYLKDTAFEKLPVEAI